MNAPSSRDKTQQSRSPIEVTKITPVDKGNLRAFVSVRVGAVLIHGFKVVRQPGQIPWVAFPQEKVGEKWFARVEILSDDLKDRVFAAILEAWEKHAGARR